MCLYLVIYIYVCEMCLCLMICVCACNITRNMGAHSEEAAKAYRRRQKIAKRNKKKGSSIETIYAIAHFLAPIAARIHQFPMKRETPTSILLI